MRIFLACPFTRYLRAQSDPNAGMRVDPTFAEFLTSIETTLTNAHHQVFLAIRHEEFGAKLRSPEICTPFDLLEMQLADCVVALPEESYGVHIELGWATAMNKPIILLLKHNQSITSPLLAGLPCISNCTILHLPEPLRSTKREHEELAHHLLEALSSIPVRKKTLPAWAFLSTHSDRESIIRTIQVAQDLNAQGCFTEAHYFGSGIDYEIAIRSSSFSRAFNVRSDQQTALAELVPYLMEYHSVFLVSRAGPLHVTNLQDIHTGSEPATYVQGR